jgi:Xaa-Pro aminopeptidase
MVSIQKQQGVTRIPRARLLDLNFQYDHSTKTDVTRTWLRFGWTPPSRERQARIYALVNSISGRTP